MEFAASFSGGKDSTLAIKRMLDRGHRIVAIIVSGKEDKESSWTHNIKREYFKKAAEIFRCELIFTDTNVEDYEEKFERYNRNKTCNNVSTRGKYNRFKN